MKDYTKTLPDHVGKYVGENDLFLEIFERMEHGEVKEKRPPLLFVHGAYTGSWMWSKYIPHFLKDGWDCYAMNLRCHYKSRVLDLTRVSFEDYLEDITEVINECNEPPILIGFSMGGILCQKLAETAEISGLILIDTSISMEVNQAVPYREPDEKQLGMIVPAPIRDEGTSIDESEEDILFQKKYLAMESSKAFGACACWVKGISGISINGSLITCPCLVIKAVNSETDERQGLATAEQLRAEYFGLSNTSHTGLLMGQRYNAVVDIIIKWLKRFKC